MNSSGAALAFLVCLGLVGQAAADPPRARIETGVVVGEIVGSAEVFRGIPYAAAPLGSMRWSPPAPALR